MNFIFFVCNSKFLFLLLVLKPIWSVRGHASVVNSIDGAPLTQSSAPELVTGSRDGLLCFPISLSSHIPLIFFFFWFLSYLGNVCVWDQRTNKAVARFKSKTAGADIWNVRFCSSFGIERGVLMGADTGDLKLVDLKNMQVVYQHSFERGVTSIANNGQFLSVCGTHGQLQFGSFSPKSDTENTRFQWTTPVSFFCSAKLKVNPLFVFFGCY